MEFYYMTVNDEGWSCGALGQVPPKRHRHLETVFQQTVNAVTASLFLTNAFSPLLLCYKGCNIFINCGKIISYLTPSIESFHETHFWPCIIHGYSSPTLAQGGSALSQPPSQDISL